jgi:cysteinyl-tRNA synthetase
LEIKERSKIETNPPEEIIRLANNRQQARDNKDWQSADEYRIQIEKSGWIVKDTKDGYTLEKSN